MDEQLLLNTELPNQSITSNSEYTTVRITQR